MGRGRNHTAQDEEAGGQGQTVVPAVDPGQCNSHPFSDVKPINTMYLSKCQCVLIIFNLGRGRGGPRGGREKE